MNPRIQQIALSLSSGRGSHSTVIFNQGSVSAPFSVGSNGDWRVQARGVEAIHLYLYFDGERAYVAAASEQARVFVPGAQVGCSWLPLVVPSRLWFGTACIVIQAQAADGRGSASQRPLRAFAAGTLKLPDFSQASEPQTRILDLAAAGLRKTQRFETPESMLALLREAGAEPHNASPEPRAAEQSNAPPPRKELTERAAPASKRAGHATAVPDLATPSTAASFEPVPVGTTTVIFSSPAAANAALTSTLYDGGRLRDYAARLAANAPSPTAATAPPHATASSGADAAVSSQPPVVLSRRSSKAKPERLALALRVGGLCLALLAIAGVWARQQSAKANPSLPRIAAAAPGGTALSAAAPTAAARPAPPSAPRATLAVAAAASASAGSTLAAPALSAPHSGVSPSRSAAPSPSAAPSSSAAPSVAPSSSAALSAASANPSQAALAPESTELAGTEHAAFAAAFSGNDSSAAALYAKLAADSHSRTFELAARLAREGRIRKP
jgi:hypothetical protein